ncbi:hypothetical protein [Cellulomonas cellasea]|uniref:Tc toxin complex TcA C-terminal TcB-binding domain-containing protein n=2 Tax=Cellulomonas cellasea TaxID=43670 RepID=A0A0A0BDM4_9CELL|nr:hypothetical protein [Cellulomonas cellasea]KGM03416.1 hypothetical protein Q760_04060 [Cellulomonas cellasea DSM 20118]GEA90251.1 hypothetical protein CCE01nite_42000 [Cellulomonas cellasea]
MAVVAETYSFRHASAVLTEFVTAHTPAGGGKPAAAELAAIESALVEATAAVTARRYQDAVEAYRSAERLIWRQLNPRSTWEWSSTVDLSRHVSLLEPLVEISLAWLAVLPLPGPRPGPVSTRPLDDSVLASTAALDATGLRATAVRTAADAAAASSVAFGSALGAAGQAGSAQVVLDRAKELAPNLVPRLEEAVDLGPAIHRDLLLPRARVLDPGAAGVFRALRLPASERIELPTAVTADRTLLLADAGGAVQELTWTAGAEPVAEVVRLLYADRVTRTDLLDRFVRPKEASDAVLGLAHAYFYEIPLGLAECHHALGDWARAEEQYLRAASYSFLNTETEAPFVWLRLGTLYVDWGIAHYRQDEHAEALAVLGKVLSPDGSAPASPLWDTPGLAGPAAAARALLPLPAEPAGLAGDAATATVLLTAWEQLVKLAAGLDFWGMPTQFVPIWTYDYLRSVAVEFAQLAVSAERDVVAYWSRADAARLTQAQLVQSTAQARAEAAATRLQRDATSAEVTVYDRAVGLAAQRAADATTDADTYATTSSQALMHSALSAQLSGGDDGNARQLDALADRMVLGNYRLSGDRGTLAAAESLAAQRLNRDYEVDRMRRQAAQLLQAEAQAVAERAAARARLAAADAAVAVADLRARHADELVAVFDDATFTPEVWWRMGEVMHGIYRRYLTMALRVARLMQQAYNFETDQALTLIRADYSLLEVNGLLGADALLADISQLQYDLVAVARGKPQPVKHTVSLAESHGLAFETGLRQTGVMEFETDVDEFDHAFPGTYAGRIEAVEVEVEGLVPVRGVRGFLTNNGVSAYRVPGAPAAVKFRLQPRETLVLSEYERRRDGLLVADDTRARGVFQGAGVCSSWRLELPKAVNELDFGALTDVRLTFYYSARYDRDLHEQVLTELAERPSVHGRQRAVPLRWLYPDLFYLLQDTGELVLPLTASDFPRSQRDPVLTELGLVLTTDGSRSAQGITVEVAPPAAADAVAATTDAAGIIGSETGPWVGLATGPAIGDWRISIPEAANAGLDRAVVANLALLLGYSYTPRA